MARIAAVAASAALVSSTVSAAPQTVLKFRDQAAEINGAARLASAYGVVTSTLRTVAHNKIVGGVPNSYHLLDRAIDIARRPGVTHQQIDAALRRAGFNLIESLDERDHSHFAFAALPLPAAALATPSAAPAPASKPLPRVAADEHGTLSLDLTVQGGTAAGANEPR
jgi:Peptidase M15